jgi:NAD-dependent protein deacetylase/lipoamidase
MGIEGKLEGLQDSLTEATHITIFTGAGISAESGVPTFRSPDGIWARFKPEELANINAFMANPERVWEWYEHRRTVVAEAKPNPGHYAIVEFEELFDRVDVITQNVDGLHARAGSKRIYELHGSLHAHRCLECSSPYTLSTKEQGIPRCPACGGLIRPGVVWFGEDLPRDIWQQAEEATRACDLFLSVGTSTVVYPAAQLPFLALSLGKQVIEINPEATDLTRHADVVLEGAAGEVLPRFAEYVRKIRNK